MRTYIVNHREFDTIPSLSGYYPLLAGASQKPEEIKKNICCDDTGDNISGLNDSCCELTGLYWMWKNVTEQVIGLVHYRRYFMFTDTKKVISFHDELYLKDPFDTSVLHIMTENEAEKLLERYDVIVNISRTYHWTIREKLLDYVPGECLDNLLSVMDINGSAEYADFLKYLKKHSHVLFNMFIGKKQVIDQYCEWLFPILAEVDKKHTEYSGQRYRKRELGYLAEILFGFWLEENGIRYYCSKVLAPRRSPIHTIDGVTLPDGSNVYYLKDLLPRVIGLILRTQK